MFNRRERNGVFVLLSIILILILYLSFFEFFFPKERTDFSKFEKEIAAFESEQKRANDSASSDKILFASSYTPATDSIERFNFNPNDLPEEDWKRLGLSDKQIHTIKNYESKGGRFRTKEDVKKMYCITPQLYASLETYIQIPQENKSEATYKFKDDKVIVELNSADTTELQKIKGIGSSFAKRIVKFRDLLGGFVRKEQLMEVYGFDQGKFDLISGQIKLDTSSVKKININTASVDDLRQHPYINKKLSVAIFTHRISNGDFKDVQEIKEISFVDDELYSKLAPYLKIE